MNDWKIWTIIGLFIFILGAAWYITTPQYIEKGKYFAGKVKKLSVNENYGLIEVCDNVNGAHQCELVLYIYDEIDDLKTGDSIIFEATYFPLNENLIFATRIQRFNHELNNANFIFLAIQSRFDSHGFDHNINLNGDHKAWHIIKGQNNTQIITNLLSTGNIGNGVVSFSLKSTNPTDTSIINKHIRLSTLQRKRIDTTNYHLFEFIGDVGDTLKLHAH